SVPFAGIAVEPQRGSATPASAPSAGQIVPMTYGLRVHAAAPSTASTSGTTRHARRIIPLHNARDRESATRARQLGAAFGRLSRAPDLALRPLEDGLAAALDGHVLEIDVVARFGLALAPRLARDVEVAVAVDVSDARVVPARVHGHRVLLEGALA